MFKRVISVTLIMLLVNVAGVRLVYGESKEEKEARFTEKVKASILTLGTGEAARVKIKLRDKSKLDGYISAADDESFTVISTKTGLATTVAYPQVKSVKGNNLSTGAKIAIGVGIAAAIFLIILYRALHDDDN